MEELFGTTLPGRQDRHLLRVARLLYQEDHRRHLRQEDQRRYLRWAVALVRERAVALVRERAMALVRERTMALPILRPRTPYVPQDNIPPQTRVALSTCPHASTVQPGGLLAVTLSAEPEDVKVLTAAL